MAGEEYDDIACTTRGTGKHIYVIEEGRAQSVSTPYPAFLSSSGISKYPMTRDTISM